MQTSFMDNGPLINMKDSEWGRGWMTTLIFSSLYLQ